MPREGFPTEQQAFRLWAKCLLAAIFWAAPVVVEAAPPLRVMSFNIRGDFQQGVASAKPNVWLSTNGAHRRDLVLCLIEKHDPDLLGVQEAFANQADAIAAKLTSHQSYGVGRDDGRLAGEQCTIYFRTERFEKSDSGVFWLCDTPDKPGAKHPDAACTRIATWVQLKDKAVDRKLLVLNTHWDHVSRKARRFAAEQIRQYLDQRDKQEAVILLGDLNAIEPSPPVQILLGKAGRAKQLFDTYREVHPSRREEEATSHGFKLRRKGSRIDYVLRSEGLMTKSASIVREDEPDEPISDHYPVTAVLEWKP